MHWLVNSHPLPHIEDNLNTLGGARFFCSLDLASGYWQVEVGDQEGWSVRQCQAPCPGVKMFCKFFQVSVLLWRHG